MVPKDTLQQFIFRHKNDASVLGSGASRVALYCKKYNKVFKYEIGPYMPSPTQSEQEYQIAQSLPEKYKKFLPVEQMEHVEYQKRMVCVTVMPVIQILDNDKALVKKCRGWDPNLDVIAEHYNLPADMMSEFKQFIREFKITDIGLRNLGMIGRTIVVVDAGLISRW